MNERTKLQLYFFQILWYLEKPKLHATLKRKRKKKLITSTRKL